MFLAIDQGTTSTRAILFDESFEVVKIARRKFKQIYPKEGWVEHDPNEIWKTVEEVVKEILDGQDAKKIKAMGITNQRETVVAWDAKTGKPLYNAIVWQCRRTAPMTEELKKFHGDFIHERTGLVVDPYFSASKMKWMIDNVDEVRKALDMGTLRFGTIDSFLAYKMTGKHVTDHSNASRTMLYNIHNGNWDDELLNIFSIPKFTLPEIINTAKVIDVTKWGILLSALVGDQQGALFGQLAFDEGNVKLTMGTGSFILMNTGENAVLSDKGLLTTVGWKIGEKKTYALEGSVFITGALIDWLVSIGLFKDPVEISELADKSENGGVYLVPAFTGLGAPHWDPTARGLLIGITRATARENIARAALEGIAFSIKEIIDIMAEDSGIEINVLRVDGGVSNSDVLLKIISKSTGVAVQRPKVVETTARGAAMLAAVGSGLTNMDDLRSYMKIDVEISEKKGLKEEYNVWKKALKRSKNWTT